MVALNSLQAAYSNKVSKLESDQQAKKNVAVQEYGNDLNTALKAVQKAGDFDGFVLVEKEVNRFKADKNVPASSDIPQLASSLTTYQKKLEKFAAELSLKRIELGKQYLDALVGLRKEMMIQGKMKEAGVVNDLAKQVEASIKAMEFRQNVGGENQSGPSNSETKLDELFADDPSVGKPRTDEKEASQPPKVSNEVKKSKKGPPEAVEFNGHFYLFYKDPMKWDIAKLKCQSRGGYLVTISSKEENDFVASLIEGSSTVWIGFSKAGDTWRWANLEKTGYTNWGSRKPSIIKPSPRMGVGICAYIHTNNKYVSSTYVDGKYKPGYTEKSGDWVDAYGDLAVEGYLCEWSE
jgi:Lectin C-type domain